ncbi:MULTISPECIES: hypothetical protein [Nostoc]|uniref:Uncharacterized protein n=1 Tax=Nostoc punctiforme FACHB-252 TaxID=1357509 RepID=A0ABR8HJF6_NOSPU|nr:MULTISPECIES: hypothetical protein [Nostoc]MBC1237339.1 hypothetical protein [Nostoc sp. 2RC]MBD2615949.1 hypothetical protein [Nostoc punctiforme FACHB-252]
MTQTQESPLTEQLSLHSEEEIQSRNNFAAMNGVDIEIEASDSHLSSIPEPEEIITTRAVSQNPLLKMGVIGGGILVFIMLIGGVITSSMNALNMATSKKIEPPKNSQEMDKAEGVNEIGETKTALALTSQNVEFQKIRDKKAQATPTPNPTFTPVAVAPTPITRAIPQRTQPVRVSRNPIPPRINNPPSSLTRRYQPPAMPVVRVTPPIPSGTVKTPTQDPTQQWLAAANAGSFSSTRDSEDEELNANGIEGKIGETTEIKNETTPQAVDYNAKRVLVGSTTEGKLETPIAWGTGDDIGQNYLIKISKSLKASDDSEVLPVGSYLVAQLINSNGSGFAQLHGVSVLINSNGDTQEKKLPENAVLIMSKNGSFLKAESRRGSDLGGDFMSAVIAGVAKAASIQNRPKTQITTTSHDFLSTSTTNDDKDLTAAFGEGAFGNILENIKASNERRSGQLNNQEKVFVIDAGKTVQIFVNQTIWL